MKLILDYYIIKSKISIKNYIIILIFISIYIYEVNIIYSSRLKKDKKKKIIFTFWEPYQKLPGYLNLCIKTWKKFLPEYEIKLLDYKNVKKYLGDSLFSSILRKDMPLPIQADAIRVALLKKYGGIWMDADTIILNGDFLKELENFELAMLGEEKSKTQNIGFIFASYNSSIINEWFKEIINNIHIYDQNMKLAQINSNFKTANKRLTTWNFLGNSIIDRLLKNITGKKILRIDRYKINALPEITFFKKYSLVNRYKSFYFKDRDPYIILNNSKSILLLHNSWTPQKYRTMKEKTFLEQNILLSKLLSKLLNIRI